MDVLLSRVTQHAMNYAIRSGVTIATTYTIKQCGRLLQQTPKSQEREEIAHLQNRLESKIRIISPAIDMIELISARGHTSLESAVSLTKDIRSSIQILGTQLRVAAEEQDLIHRKSKRAKSRQESEYALHRIIGEMKALIGKIDDAVPLVNLAITTSGVNLSTKLATTVSPSRLLQASTFLSAADAAYTANPGDRIQVGPTFVVSLYMLFAGHAFRDEAGIRDTTWKEVMHKAHVKLVRLPLDDQTTESIDTTTFRESTRAAEFAYQLAIIEDFDDDRVHSFESGEEPTPFEDVQSAGIRCVVPIHEISKLFYADTGKILNIRGDDEDNTPILLMKRDMNAIPPRRMMPQSPFSDHDSEDTLPSSPPAQDRKRPTDSSRWKLPADLDLEWMALEVFSISDHCDELDEDDEVRRTSGSSLNNLFSALSFRNQSSPSSAPGIQSAINELQSSSRESSIKTSLSLLEMLVKLTALQQFRQESHLAIEDELLNFFLEDSATAGAGGDKTRRQHIRQHAIQKVGFDPYDESPVKRRGEAYIRASHAESSRHSTPLLIASREPRSSETCSEGEPVPLRDFSGGNSAHPTLKLCEPPLLKSDRSSSRLGGNATPSKDNAGDRPQTVRKETAQGHRTPFITPTASDMSECSPSPLSL